MSAKQSFTLYMSITGKRRCIGESLASMELFIHITYLLHHFTIPGHENKRWRPHHSPPRSVQGHSSQPLKTSSDVLGPSVQYCSDFHKIKFLSYDTAKTRLITRIFVQYFVWHICSFYCFCFHAQLLLYIESKYSRPPSNVVLVKRTFRRTQRFFKSPITVAA